MEFELKFRNDIQKNFFFCRKRNVCFSGGYGNGKTYVACQKIVMLSVLFPGYRSIIARKKYVDLKKTTMKTFFKVCPKKLIKSHNNQEGITVLTNGSEILWLHLDSADEISLRGLEINSVVIDQGEEIEEGVYLTLDARIGRWDKAEVPYDLPFGLKREDFPTNVDGVPIPPSYMMVLCNPDVETHWIWRRYHPDSVENKNNYGYTHGYFERGTDETMYSPDTIKQLKSRDPEWVRRFFLGQWGISEGSIHFVRPESILQVPLKWVQNLIQRSVLARSFDHGETSPTCCTWSAYTPEKQLIFFREYYVPNQLISYHRKAIAALSKGEHYYANVADPSIFQKSKQKDGAFWTVATEYLDKNYTAESIAWTPADNEELGTRNRINELLIPSTRYRHPITGESPAPGLYFVERSHEVIDGCENLIIETKSQRREVIGSLNGRTLYSDKRDEKVVDHAYDTLRYMVALHMNPDRSIKRRYPAGSMGHYREMVKQLHREGHYESY